jgi:hypothetical protein
MGSSYGKVKVKVRIKVEFLDAPIPLLPAKDFPLPVEQEASLIPDPVWKTLELLHGVESRNV